MQWTVQTIIAGLSEEWSHKKILSPQNILIKYGGMKSEVGSATVLTSVTNQLNFLDWFILICYEKEKKINKRWVIRLIPFTNRHVQRQVPRKFEWTSAVGQPFFDSSWLWWFRFRHAAPAFRWHNKTSPPQT